MGADIFGANYYGVVVNGGSRSNVTGSTIHDIGEVAVQRLAARCRRALHDDRPGRDGHWTSATGTLSGNTIFNYQKNGVVISGSGASVVVDSNTVTGFGPANFIAQNGIQISFGATAKVTNNAVTGNNYTPAKVTACGLLLFKAGGVSASKKGISALKADNNLDGNETDFCNFGKGGGFDAAG